MTCSTYFVRSVKGCGMATPHQTILPPPRQFFPKNSASKKSPLDNSHPSNSQHRGFPLNDFLPRIASRKGLGLRPGLSALVRRKLSGEELSKNRYTKKEFATQNFKCHLNSWELDDRSSNGQCFLSCALDTYLL